MSREDDEDLSKLRNPWRVKVNTNTSISPIIPSVILSSLIRHFVGWIPNESFFVFLDIYCHTHSTLIGQRRQPNKLPTHHGRPLGNGPLLGNRDITDSTFLRRSPYGDIYYMQQEDKKSATLSDAYAPRSKWPPTYNIRNIYLAPYYLLDQLTQQLVVDILAGCVTLDLTAHRKFMCHQWLPPLHCDACQAEAEGFKDHEYICELDLLNISSKLIICMLTNMATLYNQCSAEIDEWIDARWSGPADAPVNLFYKKIMYQHAYRKVAWSHRDNFIELLFGLWCAFEDDIGSANNRQKNLSMGMPHIEDDSMCKKYLGKGPHVIHMIGIVQFHVRHMYECDCPKAKRKQKQSNKRKISAKNPLFLRGFAQEPLEERKRAMISYAKAKKQAEEVMISAKPENKTPIPLVKKITQEVPQQEHRGPIMVDNIIPIAPVKPIASTAPIRFKYNHTCKKKKSALRASLLDTRSRIVLRIPRLLLKKNGKFDQTFGRNQCKSPDDRHRIKSVIWRPPHEHLLSQSDSMAPATYKVLCDNKTKNQGESAPNYPLAAKEPDTSEDILELERASISHLPEEILSGGIDNMAFARAAHYFEHAVLDDSLMDDQSETSDINILF